MQIHLAPMTTFGRLLNLQALEQCYVAAGSVELLENHKISLISHEIAKLVTSKVSQSPMHT